MKSEILKLRKQIYLYLKRKALSYEIGTEELENYFSNQDQYSDREFEIASMDKLLNQVKRSDVIFIGDFHTFDQNIRNVLRIIKNMITQNRKPIIGLEMIDHRFQLVLDTYLESQLTELEFLEEIDYHDSWRFPWSHYKLIFELAKEHDIAIKALNKKGSLEERDHFAANLILNIHRDNPENKLVILYGELHIAPNKIPAMLENLNDSLKQTIIHQNLDKVYWRLAESGQHADVVNFNSEEFCLLTAPPWVKYESMVYWYENLCDDPDFDIHDYIIENGKKIFSDDTHENFSLICAQIINTLNLEITMDEIDNFNLYDHTNLDYVEELLSESMDSDLNQFYQELIATNYSFSFLENKFYCSSYSMNRISYLAGIHILHFYIEKKGLHRLSALSTNDKLAFFTLQVFEALFAYFFSKVINPHRKCNLYIDYQKSSRERDKLVLELFEGKLDVDSLVKLNRITSFKVATDFGHCLGEYLYQKEVESKKLAHVSAILNDLSFQIDSFYRSRDLILKGVAFKSHQKRYF